MQSDVVFETRGEEDLIDASGGVDGAGGLVDVGWFGEEGVAYVCEGDGEVDGELDEVGDVYDEVFGLLS